MNWSSEHIASTVVFSGYGIWFAVVFIRRLLAPAMHMFAFTDRLRGMSLSVLLLPALIAVNGLWGTLAHRFLLASPGIALAFWTCRTTTRTDAVATAQLSRLDRDLHDRTQAALVALGMSPTTIPIEVPCALSSPRISSYSGTA